MTKRLGYDATELAQRMRVDARGSIINVMRPCKDCLNMSRLHPCASCSGMKRLGPRATDNLDNLRRAFELVDDEASYAGAMQAEYEGVAGTTSARLVVFRNHPARASISLMPLPSVITDVTEALQPMLQRMANWMQANLEAVKWIGMTVASLFGRGVLDVQRRAGGGHLGLWGGCPGRCGAGSRVCDSAHGFGAGGAGGTALGSAFLLNPVGIAIAAIAAGAWLVWQIREPISAWFTSLWDNLSDIFGGFTQSIHVGFSGAMAGAADDLCRMWGGMTGCYQTLWDGISGIFTWAWNNAIKPVTNALGMTEPIVAGRGRGGKALNSVTGANGGRSALATIHPIRAMPG